LPTVFIINGIKFFFWSNEGNEPIHIHIRKAEFSAKIWIEDYTIAYNYGFSDKDMKYIIELIKEHEEEIKIKWGEYIEKNR